MAMLGQSSFRRILLLRILLLSIPILFLGMAVTFRKARSSLLTTARSNLEQSAVVKAQAIRESIEDLQTSLAIAAETAPLQFGSPGSSKILLDRLQRQLPTSVHCLQLKDLQTNQLITSTCGNLVLDPVSTRDWPAKRRLTDKSRLLVHTLTPNRVNRPAQVKMESQLDLVVSVPVYNSAGQLRYSLTAQATLKQLESAAPWLLQGYTMVIGQDGTILAHPLAERVGMNIAQQPAADRFQDILNNVLRRAEKDTRHLYGITSEPGEWIAGFSPMTIPVGANENQTWAVLAITRMDSALRGLQDITQILLISTAGLLAAHLLAMLYMARDLALPIEQLGKYALNIHKRDALVRTPKNFRIRELNHLAEVLDNMVGRLEERAKELEAAWQEAETANQLKSEFLANTSHELRTPLNAIIGCIRLVKDDCCDSKEEEVEFLEQADKAAIHLLKIINDLLDIQRIEEEKLPLAIETIDLRQIVKEAVDLQAVQIQQKGLELTVTDIPTAILVRADAARLKQVLLNVLYNATKFTDHGGITISTRLETQTDSAAPPANAPSTYQNGHRYEPDEPETTWVVVSIQDTGIGIEPAQQHKLFRPFAMVDGTTTRKYEGTGLGLAISRNLIELMGGRITLFSAGLDQGTTVQIALPVVEPVPGSSAVDPGTGAPKSVVEHSAIG